VILDTLLNFVEWLASLPVVKLPFFKAGDPSMCEGVMGIHHSS
jgi:hypothetical protein